MIVIFNTEVSTLAAKKDFPETECPHCKSKGYVRMDIFNVKIVNMVVGVSMPTKARGDLVCGNCRKEIPKKQWGQEHKQAADELGRQYRNKFRIWPRWFLVGMVLFFALLIGGGLVYQKFFYVNKFEEAAKAAKVAVESPKPGMVLAFNFQKATERSSGVDAGSFALVENVDGGALEVRLSKVTDEDPFFFTVPNRKFKRTDFEDATVPARIDSYGSIILINPKTGKEDYCKIQNAYVDAVD